jgi:hypothetical protein
LHVVPAANTTATGGTLVVILLIFGNDLRRAPQPGRLAQRIDVEFADGKQTLAHVAPRP